jgi:hypothetical protein
MADWVVQVNVTRGQKDTSISTGLVTFILDGDMLGIVSESHAKGIATRMIRELGPMLPGDYVKGIEVSVQKRDQERSPRGQV